MTSKGSSRNFGKLGEVLDEILAGYAFAANPEEPLIERAVRAADAAEATALELEELIGFDFLREAKFDYGAAHPEKVSSEQIKAFTTLNIGQSMIDAFSPFDRAFRYVFRQRVRYEEVCLKHDMNCNIVTFGSPSSNGLARALLGYRRDPAKKFSLLKTADADRFPITYELDDDNGIVRRNGTAYLEPKWGLSTPERRIDTLLTTQHSLVDDYLVLSCLPNTLSPVMKARSEVARLAGQPDHHTQMIDSAAYATEFERLVALAASGQPNHRVLIVGGLHGPGTAATRLLLSDPQNARRLKQRVREERLDGKYWQALIHIREVGFNERTRRDFPRAISNRIDVFPVDVA